MGFPLRMAAIAAILVSVAPAQTKLLRFPDVHGDAIVFCYAGDLWKVSTDGGTAVRLTAHPGLELFPKFSPDGARIAFTGQYDGDEQVYVIPAGGGKPKQLTWYPARGPLAARWGYDHHVYGWTPDGERVLFRSTREFWGPKDGRLYTVAADGGLPQPLAMPVSGAGGFSPDGQQVVYSPLFRDFRTWKRYEGGWAQNLYVFYPQTNETKRITDHPRSDRDPMWVGDAIYFASDRDGKLNLYRYDIASSDTTQVTAEKTWDVRWPSSDGKSQIVYELDGELHLLDTASGRSRRVPVTVPDDGVHMRPGRVAAAKFIEGFSLSPKGERALFTARGDVHTAPIEKGPARNLTNTPGAHEREAVWSPDGRRVVYISDRTGEEELFAADQSGTGQAEQLTEGGQAKKYRPVWSPDSERIAFSDKDGTLFVLTMADKSVVEIARDTWGQVADYVWSPDSRWLAVPLQTGQRASSIFIWGVQDARLQRITDEIFTDKSPAWDPEGKYLSYLSEREFAPQISGIEWNFAGNRMTGIFALALRKDAGHPFPPESDEVELQEEKTAEDEKEPENGNGKRVEIDFEGLADRVARVPAEAGNYSGLTAKKGHLLIRSVPASYYGRQAAAKPELKIFSLKEREFATIAGDAQAYELSHDGEKVLVRHPSGYALYDAAAKGSESKKDVSTAGLMTDAAPAEEWRAMFGEVWRRYRDFFYVENMHGYDWEALQAQYEPWLDHVAHRADLNYVIGEMIAELNVGHAYISGGDYEIPGRPEVALPGAEFEFDSGAGRYRIGKILKGQNEESAYRSPLTEIGVDAREGDYVLAIDGEELQPDDNPYRLLRHKAGRPVTLTLNAEPSFDGAREVSFQPLTDESNLRYLAWVKSNMRRVEEATDGRVGYLHIPDMGAQGIREFIKWFYPQLRKEGLVIDVRGNGGGNVSQMILERLQRTLLGTWFSRTSDHPDTYPEAVFHGHMVCLISENSASDGDIFPARFKKAGLGPLIGKRSWGGVIGITNRGPLLDGGEVFVPEFATNDVDGSWIIEGYGVDPDIEVENPPAAVIAGRDPQLERGIEEVMRRIREEPRRLPERPAPPVKTP